MTVTRFLGRALLAVTLGVAAACHDSTGPGTTSTIDAQTALTQMQPVAAVLDQPAFVSLQGAGAFFGGSFGLGPVASLTTKLSQGSFDARVLRSVVPTAEVSASVVPTDLKGSTYVYNVDLGAYVIDTHATGAPASGVRIVLYTWDPLTGEPATPLTRVGYVDLVDESTTSSDVLHVRLVRDAGGVVLADYSISHSTSASGETFGINGSANNGATTVNFSLNATSSGAPGAQKVFVSFGISAPSLGTSVGLQMSVDEGAGTLNVGISLGYDGHSLTFVLNGTGDNVTGEIRFDGKLYATYESTYNPASGEHTEQFLKADGQPLTGDELERLSTLFQSALSVGGFWTALTWPVGMFGAA